MILNLNPSGLDSKANEERHHCGELRRERAEQKGERRVAEERTSPGWKEKDLADRRKNDPGKLALAARRRRETTLPIQWIASRLQIGTQKGARTVLHQLAVLEVKVGDRINANLLWSEDELFLCDHEQAFSFLMGVIGWQPPWTGQGTEFLRQHVFFQQLAGLQHDWSRLTGALDALTDARLAEYIEAVPNEWRSNSKAAEDIADYLGKARQNRTALFGVINHLLQ